VEQKVKGELYDLNQKTKGENEGYVHYSVDVGENDSYKKAAFRCKWLVEYPLNTLSDEKEEVIVSDLGKDKGGFGGGKKKEKSPKDWQHGSSKGGKEVTSVKKRLDEAVDAGNITFTNKKSDDPEITNETDEQDMLEWLNDYVDEKGYDNAMSVLVKLEKKYAKMPKKSRLIRYVKRQLRSMGDD